MLQVLLVHDDVVDNSDLAEDGEDTTLHLLPTPDFLMGS